MRRNLTIAMSLGLTGFAVLVVLLISVYISAHFPLPWVDWQTYADAEQRLLSGGSPYDPRQLSGSYTLGDMSNVGVYGYEYPPSSLVLFLPFASKPIGLILWLAMAIGLMVSGIYAILRRELGEDAIVYLGIACLPVLLWPGFIEGVRAGNVTIPLCGLLAWSWALGRERLPAAAVAAAGVAKVFPATLVFWTRPRRLIRSLRDVVLIAAAWSLVTLPIVGVQSWFDFLKAMGNVQPTCAPIPYSPTCLLAPLMGVPAAKMAALAIAGTMAAGSVFVRRDLVAYALLAGSWVVTAYNMSYYSTLPLVVVGVVALAVGMREFRSRRGGESPAGASRMVGEEGVEPTRRLRGTSS